MLSKEIGGRSIKFLSFHEFSCPLGAGYTVDSYRGHIMGRQIGPRHTFHRRRIFIDKVTGKEDLESRLMDFSSFDEITQEFFHECYEDSRKPGRAAKSLKRPTLFKPGQALSDNLPHLRRPFSTG